MARPGMMLYFDILPALDKLPSSAVGELLLAALHYAQDGIEPAFEDSSLGFAWAFLRPAIDRDGATYEGKRLKGDWLTYCRQCKKMGLTHSTLKRGMNVSITVRYTPLTYRQRPRYQLQLQLQII